MRTLIGAMLAGTMLLSSAAFAAHPVKNETNAAGHQVGRAWHAAAANGQRFAARHSWSRRRRGYHLRKAAAHAGKARAHKHAAGAAAHAAHQK